MSYTPGPWMHCRPTGAVKTTDGTYKLVASVFGDNHACEEDDRQIDNARLIAAAPDLLEALKLLVADVADYPAWQRPCHALDEAQVAIAKATGIEHNAVPEVRE